MTKKLVKGLVAALSVGVIISEVFFVYHNLPILSQMPATDQFAAVSTSSSGGTCDFSGDLDPNYEIHQVFPCSMKASVDTIIKTSKALFSGSIDDDEINVDTLWTAALNRFGSGATAAAGCLTFPDQTGSLLKAMGLDPGQRNLTYIYANSQGWVNAVGNQRTFCKAGLLSAVESSKTLKGYVKVTATIVPSTACPLSEKSPSKMVTVTVNPTAPTAANVASPSKIVTSFLLYDRNANYPLGEITSQSFPVTFSFDASKFGSASKPYSSYTLAANVSVFKKTSLNQEYVSATSRPTSNPFNVGLGGCPGPVSPTKVTLSLNPALSCATLSMSAAYDGSLQALTLDKSATNKTFPYKEVSMDFFVDGKFAGRQIRDGATDTSTGPLVFTSPTSNSKIFTKRDTTAHTFYVNMYLPVLTKSANGAGTYSLGTLSPIKSNVVTGSMPASCFPQGPISNIPTTSPAPTTNPTNGTCWTNATTDGSCPDNPNDPNDVPVPAPTPIVTLTASGMSYLTVDEGTNVSFSWTTKNVDGSCIASDGWSGTKALNGGTQQLQVSSSQNYWITCTNKSGKSAKAKATVIVNPAPPPPPPKAGLSATVSKCNATLVITAPLATGYAAITSLSANFYVDGKSIGAGDSSSVAARTVTKAVNLFTSAASSPTTHTISATVTVYYGGNGVTYQSDPKQITVDTIANCQTTIGGGVTPPTFNQMCLKYNGTYYTAYDQCVLFTQKPDIYSPTHYYGCFRNGYDVCISACAQTGPPYNVYAGSNVSYCQDLGSSY